MTLGQLCQQLRAAVGAAVVDDQDLVVGCDASALGIDPLDQLGETLDLVVGRDQNGQVELGFGIVENLPKGL